MTYCNINSRQLPKEGEGSFPRLPLWPTAGDRFLHSISDLNADFSVPPTRRLSAYIDYRVTLIFFG